jgi:hypothetical protein
MRTPEAVELERLFGPCVPAHAEESENSFACRRRPLKLKSHEQSCAIAIGLFVLALFVLSFVAMLFAATAA